MLVFLTAILLSEPVEAPVPAVLPIVRHDVAVIEVNHWGSGSVQHVWWDTAYVKNDDNACHRLVLVNREYRMGMASPSEGITQTGGALRTRSRRAGGLSWFVRRCC